MKTVKLIVTVESHLSDILMDMSYDPQMAKHRVRFLKWLLLRKRDLNQEVDIDALYLNFLSYEQDQTLASQL